MRGQGELEGVGEVDMGDISTGAPEGEGEVETGRGSVGLVVEIGVEIGDESTGGKEDTCGDEGTPLHAGEGREQGGVVLPKKFSCWPVGKADTEVDSVGGKSSDRGEVLEVFSSMKISLEIKTLRVVGR